MEKELFQQKLFTFHQLSNADVIGFVEGETVICDFSVRFVQMVLFSQLVSQLVVWQVRMISIQSQTIEEEFVGKAQSADQKTWTMWSSYRFIQKALFGVNESVVASHLQGRGSSPSSGLCKWSQHVLHMLDWFSSSFLPQSKGVHGRLIVVSKLLIVRWIGTLSHLVPCDLLPCTLVALFMIIRSSRSLLDCVTLHILFFNF